MPRDYKIYLSDIIASISKIEEYTENISFEEFAKEDMRSDAIIKNLMTIGEAVKNVPRDIRAKSPEIEWEEMAGLRDVLIHQYFGADMETVWGIVKDDLPKLKRNIGALLKKL